MATKDEFDVAEQLARIHRMMADQEKTWEETRKLRLDQDKVIEETRKLRLDQKYMPKDYTVRVLALGATLGVGIGAALVTAFFRH